MAKHTRESLQGKSLKDIRDIARKMGISVAGKSVSDLIKEILKKGGSSKTAEKPAKKSASKGKKKPKDEDEDEEEEEEDDEEEEEEDDEEDEADDDDEDEEDEDEEEEEDDEEDEDDVPAKKNKAGKGGTTDPGAKAPGTVVAGLLADIRTVVIALAKATKTSKIIPKGWTNEVEEPEEEDEDEEDDEDEEEDEKPAKGKKAAKKSSKNSKDEDDEEEIAVTVEDLKSMNVEQLKELIEKLNSSEGVKEKDKIDDDESSPRILRNRITEFMQKYGEKEVSDDTKPRKKGKAADDDEDEEEDESDEDEEEDEDEDDRAFVKKGASVWVDVEDEGWQEVTVTAVNKKKKTASVEDEEGTEFDAPFSELFEEKPKKKGKK